jgi:hypothetical protein
MNAINSAAEVGLSAYRMGHGMNNRGIVVRFPVGATGFSLHQGSQTGCGDLPAVSLKKIPFLISGKKHSIVKIPATTLTIDLR